MYVIADNRHFKQPSFFTRLSSADGFALISTSIKEATLFYSAKDANDALARIPKDNLFIFKVFEIGIIA